MAMVYENLTQAQLDQIWLDAFVGNEKARLQATDEKKAIRVRVGITEDQRTALRAAQDKIIARCGGTKIGLVAEFNAFKSAGDPAISYDSATTGNAWYTGSITLRGTVIRVSRANERDAWRVEFLAAIERAYRALELQRNTITNDPDPTLDVLQGQKTKRQVLLDAIAVQMASKEAEKAERIRDTSTSVPT